MSDAAYPHPGVCSNCGRERVAAKGTELSARDLAEMFSPIFDDLEHELRGAIWKFDSFNSPHEGWAVIREELDELWECVKANDGRGAEARAEALQVAAMAFRYIIDVCGEELKA